MDARTESQPYKTLSFFRYVAVVAVGILASTAQAQFKYWIASDSTTAPAKLSQTGLYVNIAAAKKAVSPNIYHFEVNSPLWSDGAHKSRWVVARPGKPIAWDTTDYWGYPDSAVFVKEFDIDTIMGDTASRVKWETRILFNRKEPWTSDPATGAITSYRDRWYGYSYKWNLGQTDADLIPVKGQIDSITVWPAGKAGAARQKKWYFPSQNDCERCHGIRKGDVLQQRSVLGFLTAQLNRQAPDTAVSMNQLDYLFAHGVLSGAKPANWNSAPKWASISDSTASIELRARSFIASNCSGCHGKRGAVNGAIMGSNVTYDFYNMIPSLELRHMRVIVDFGLRDTLPIFYPKNDSNNDHHLDTLRVDVAVIVPGYPSKSLLFQRAFARRTEPGNYDPLQMQMPPVGSYEVYDSAKIVLNKWILGMQKIPQPRDTLDQAGVKGVRHGVMKSPSIAGHLLQIPPELLGPGFAGSGASDFGPVEVNMVGISGRAVRLKPISRTTYAIPVDLPAGLYVIRIGNQKYTRYWF